MTGAFSSVSSFQTPRALAGGDDALCRLFADYDGQLEALSSRLLECLFHESQAGAARIWLRASGGSPASVIAEAGESIPAAEPLQSSSSTARRVTSGPAGSLVSMSVHELSPEATRVWAQSQRLSCALTAPIMHGRLELGLLELLSRQPVDEECILRWIPRLGLALSRLATQRQAASAEEFAFSLLRHNPVAVIGIDAAGVVRLWNPAAETLYGWSAAAAVSHRPRIIPQSHRREVEELWRRLLAGKPVSRLDTLRLRNDGAQVPVVLTAVPQFDERGNVTGVVEIHQDASSTARGSRRSHSERRLREIMERSDSIEHAGAPILQTLCELLDWPAGELWIADEQRGVLEPVAAWSAAARNDAAASLREVKIGVGLAGKTWQARQPLYLPEIDGESPGRGPARGLSDGTALHPSGFGLPIIHRNQVLGVVAFRAHCLPEPAIEERELLQAATAGLGPFIELQQTQVKLAQTEARLRQAQKMDAVGLLAGGIAHDFNNVLTVILSYSEIAAEEVDLDHPAHEMLTEIHNAGQRAASMTRKLLTFSRQQEEDLALLDLNRMVVDMERMLRRLIGPNITLETELLTGLGAIRGDASQIDQVLVNFVVNARDAMEGVGRITIATRHASFTAAQAHDIAGARSGDYVVLSVADTGSGMNESTKARIFEPFFTTKGVGRGTGMGLATVAGIVRNAGGFIRVETAPGAGTTMIVYFPKAREALATQAFDSRPDALPQGTETVLVVEEDEIIRTLMRRVVSTRGYHVLEAADAEEALRVVSTARQSISLVLTNLAMPGLSGNQLAARLRQLDKSIKVLFVVGSSDDQQLAAADDEVATLQKPFTSGVLARKIRSVLDQGCD